MGVYYDFRCNACGHTYERRVPIGTDLDACEMCDGYAERIWIKAPGMLMRPDGWNMRPDEPGYSKIPNSGKRDIYSHQFSDTTRRK